MARWRMDKSEEKDMSVCKNCNELEMDLNRFKVVCPMCRVRHLPEEFTYIAADVYCSDECEQMAKDIDLADRIADEKIHGDW